MAQVSDLISEIQDFFGSISDAQALRMLQKRDDELRGRVPIDPETETLSSLVAGTREYALSNTIAKVFSARYVRSASTGDARILQETSVDELDHTFHDWRGHGNGEPSRYYIRGGNIGFHNTPSITSSGSYPQVQLEVQKYVTLQSSTNFDGQIPRGALDAWTFHVLEEWGVMKGDERIEYFRQRKYEGFMLLVESITGRLSKYHPKIIKGLAMGQGRRII